MARSEGVAYTPDLSDVPEDSWPYLENLETEQSGLFTRMRHNGRRFDLTGAHAELATYDVVDHCCYA